MNVTETVELLTEKLSVAECSERQKESMVNDITISPYCFAFIKILNTPERYREVVGEMEESRGSARGRGRECLIP